jgi:hypothetical protein
MTYTVDIHNFDLRVLPGLTWEDFFTMKRTNEKYGYAKIPIRDLSIDYDATPLLDYVIQYWLDTFPEQSHLTHKEMCLQRPSPPRQYEQYLKLSWLTKVYLTEGYTFPLGVFWHPVRNNVDDVYLDDRNQQGHFLIHPGGGRQIILELFEDPDTQIDCIAFGTAGKQIDFKKVFTSAADFRSWCEAEYNFIPRDEAFVAAKGTLIPHPIFKDETIGQGILETTIFPLLDTLENFSVSIETDLISIPSKGTAPMQIKLRDGNDSNTVIRAMLLLPHWKFFKQNHRELLEQYGIDYHTQ